MDLRVISGCLAVMNKAVENILYKVSLWTDALISLRYIPGSGIAK
jgi:hypothetical protein